MVTATGAFYTAPVPIRVCDHCGYEDRCHQLLSAFLTSVAYVCRDTAACIARRPELGPTP